MVFGGSVWIQGALWEAVEPPNSEILCVYTVRVCVVGGRCVGG